MNWESVCWGLILFEILAFVICFGNIRAFTSDSEITSEAAEKFGREVSELVARH